MNFHESKNLLNTQLVIVDNKLYLQKKESKKLTPLDTRWKAEWKCIDDGSYSLELDHTLYQIPKEMVVNVQSAIGMHIPQSPISLFYKGKQLISYSGQSTVVLMKNILQDKMYVVKTIKKNKHLASREIQILKKLNHKNIIRLLQIFEDENKTYLIFEKFDKTISQQFDHLECQIILYKVLKALKYLHARDIVHRDLKPQNIMLTEENKVKIIDFGLSIQLVPKPTDTTFSGTPGYIAPEAFDNIYDCKYDIFSLGAIMFEMYYNDNLIKGDFITDIISNNKNFQGINITNRSQLIRDDGLDLMKKMLKILPEERISAKQALKHPYFNCFKGTGIVIKSIIPKLSDSINNCNIGRTTLPSSLRSYNDNLIFNQKS